jgi:2-oxoisovalerate dehydrogenase E1 component
MASIWKLPVLFVCENNQFATEVPISYSAGNPNVVERAPAYGMPGVLVDGNDVFEVHRAAAEAVQRARAGEGPTLLECRTYRTRPHAEGMGDFTYRTREEVEEWKTRDPIVRWRERILQEQTATAEEVEAIDLHVRSTIDEAARFAESSPWPEPQSAGRHVLHEG